MSVLADSDAKFILCRHNNAADIPDPQGWVYGKVRERSKMSALT